MTFALAIRIPGPVWGALGWDDPGLLARMEPRGRATVERFTAQRRGRGTSNVLHDATAAEAAYVLDALSAAASSIGAGDGFSPATGRKIRLLVAKLEALGLPSPG